MSSNLKNLGREILKKEILSMDILSYNYIFSSVLLFDFLELKDRKNILKNLKKSINFLLDTFDENYLLLSSNKKFNFYDNLLFLVLFEKLINILENNKFEKLSNKLNDIKLKLNLGFVRYFNLNKKNLIIDFNIENLNINLIENKKIKKEINNEIILLDILNKKFDNKKYKFDIKFLKYFPKYIYKKVDLPNLKLFKSTFFNENIDFIEIPNSKIILRDTNNLNIIILVLTILKNE